MTQTLVTDRGCSYSVHTRNKRVLNFECTCSHTPVPVARRTVPEGFSALLSWVDEVVCGVCRPRTREMSCRMNYIPPPPITCWAPRSGAHAPGSRCRFASCRASILCLSLARNKRSGAGAATALIASELQCSELQQRGEVRLSKRAQPARGDPLPRSTVFVVPASESLGVHNPGV